MRSGSNARARNSARGLGKISRTEPGRTTAKSQASCATGNPIALSPNWPHCDQYGLIEPQINAQGVHVWPFDTVLPVELRLLNGDCQRTVRKNRHDYFEIFVVCSGATSFIVEDRCLPMHQGDLAIIGSKLHHSTQCPPQMQSTIGALYFDPNFISSDGSAYSSEYLAPFLHQDLTFPHVVPFETGLPGRILDLMEMMRGELPGSSKRARLAIRTYLKMILIMLVNHYASYASHLDSFRNQQRALESLQNFLEFLPGHVGDVIYAPEAARMCGLGETQFATYLRQLTGRSFRSYLNAYRIERAQVALMETDRPISEIAQEMGFCDQSYFGAVFHRFAGMTPLAYRYRHRIVETHPGGPGHHPWLADTSLGNQLTS